MAWIVPAFQLSAPFGDVRVRDIGGPVNPAPTARSASMVTSHVPVPEHAPDHPSKLEPPLADAVSVTGVPVLKLAEQVAGQFIPAGNEVTAPVPVPLLVKVSV